MNRKSAKSRLVRRPTLVILSQDRGLSSFQKKRYSPSFHSKNFFDNIDFRKNLCSTNNNELEGKRIMNNIRENETDNQGEITYKDDGLTFDNAPCEMSANNTNINNMVCSNFIEKGRLFEKALKKDSSLLFGTKWFFMRAINKNRSSSAEIGLKHCELQDRNRSNSVDVDRKRIMVSGVYKSISQSKDENGSIYDNFMILSEADEIYGTHVTGDMGSLVELPRKSNMNIENGEFTPVSNGSIHKKDSIRNKQVCTEASPETEASRSVNATSHFLHSDEATSYDRVDDTVASKSKYIGSFPNNSPVNINSLISGGSSAKLSGSNIESEVNLSFLDASSRELNRSARKSMARRLRNEDLFTPRQEKDTFPIYSPEEFVEGTLPNIFQDASFYSGCNFNTDTESASQSDPVLESNANVGGRDHNKSNVHNPMFPDINSFYTVREKLFNKTSNMFSVHSPRYVPYDISFDTTELSTVKTEEAIINNIERYLHQDEIHSFISYVFPKCELEQKRQISRAARLQISHKRNWIKNIWKLLNEGSYDEETLWGTIQIMSSGDCDFDYGLIRSSCEVHNSFINHLTQDTFIRAAILGSPRSGKSTFLNTIYLKHILFLTASHKYKTTMIIPLDFRKHKCTTIEEFYVYYSRRAVESLIIQRPDLQVYESHIIKAFREAPKVFSKFPKPISSQNYLRRPLCDVESLIYDLHNLYNDGNMLYEFLTTTVMIPHTLAQLFGFDAVLFIVDHIDHADVKITIGKKNIKLIELIKHALEYDQYLVTAEEGLKLMEILGSREKGDIDIQKITTEIGIYGRCKSSSKCRIKVDIREGFSMYIYPETTGGCPAFVAKFEEVINQIHSLRQMQKSGSPSREYLLKESNTIIKLESLIDLLFVYDKSDTPYTIINYALQELSENGTFVNI